MKRKLLTASLCVLWTPLFVFADQGQSNKQDQQQQMSQTVSQCKRAQQSLDNASSMLQDARGKQASQSTVEDISRKVDEAKSQLDDCTAQLERMQNNQSGGSQMGGGQ